MSQNFNEPIPSTVSCSNRLFAALQIFHDIGPDSFLPTHEALMIDGRTFPYLVKGCRRGSRAWVEYVRGRGFRITAKGVAAWQSWEHTNVFRSAPATHFAESIRGLSGLGGEFAPSETNRKLVKKESHKAISIERNRAAIA